MFVKFTKNSKDLTDTKDKKKLAEGLAKTLGLEFEKDQVRYETRGAVLVENGVAVEAKEGEDTAKVLTTDKKAEQKEAPKAEVKTPVTEKAIVKK